MINIAGQEMLHNVFIWLGRTVVALFCVMLRAAWLIAGKETGMGYFVITIGFSLAVLLVISFLYFLRASPDDPTKDANQMSLALRRILLGYFLLLGALLISLLVDLNMVDFPESAVSIQMTPPATAFPASNPTVANPPADKTSNTTTGNSSQNSSQTSGSGPTEAQPAPVILQVIPRVTSGSPPTTYLAVYGTNLRAGWQVRINGEVRGTKIPGPGLLEAQPEASDIQGKGTITIDVITNDKPGKVSNCIIVAIEKPTAPLNLGRWQPYITREIQLLLIVLAAGALGCLIHGLRSIAVFIGNRNAVSSWFWWYITRPLLGMAMSLIFYALLRGGFLAGTQADAKVISPFGVLAIGALVGMFTEKASGKLADIFNLLFHSTADDANKDTIRKVTIKTTTLPDGTVGTPYNRQLEANDGSPSLTWNITGLPAGMTSDPKTGIISGTPTGPASQNNPVKIVVNDGPGNTDAKTLNLTIH
ncbi:MAG TPA: Ig domain-containing protein [Candidatus Angelobacter sp.]